MSGGRKGAARSASPRRVTGRGSFARHRAKSRSSGLSMSNPPLKGVRVIELARILAGPWAGQLLADLGADVIKVENPDGGDDTRKWGPPFVKGADGENLSAAYY